MSWPDVAEVLHTLKFSCGSVITDIVFYRIKWISPFLPTLRFTYLHLVHKPFFFEVNLSLAYFKKLLTLLNAF